MIVVVDRSGDAQLAAVGLDIAKLLQHTRNCSYAVLDLDSDCATILLCVDAEQASERVVDLLRNGAPSTGMCMPPAVQNLVQLHALDPGDSAVH